MSTANQTPPNPAGARAAEREETDPVLNPSLEAGDGNVGLGKTDGTSGQRAQAPSSGLPKPAKDPTQDADSNGGVPKETVSSDRKTAGTKRDKIPLPTPTTQNDV